VAQKFILASSRQSKAAGSGGLVASNDGGIAMPNPFAVLRFEALLNHQTRIVVQPLVVCNRIQHSYDVRNRGWNREANMPHIGPVLEGRAFFCPHCGALYSATPSLVPKSEGDAAKCVICLKVMDSLDTTKVPSFKLIQRPEDA
jgi:hypothetical protein